VKRAAVDWEKWRDQNFDKPNDIHTMPDDGKHECSHKCFCWPTINYIDEVTGKRVWLHKSDEEMNQ